MASSECAYCCQPLELGEAEEADSFRTTTKAATRPGRYFCPDSPDALHHLELCGHSSYPRDDGGCAACEEALGIGITVELATEPATGHTYYGDQRCNGWSYDPAAQAWAAQVGPGRWLTVKGEFDDPPARTPQQTLVAWGEHESMATFGQRRDFYATRVLALIHADMASPAEDGFEPIPLDVGSFSRLHDYRDANMWVIEAMGEHGFPSEDEDTANLVNAVMDAVDARLAAEAKLLTRKVCRSEPGE